MNAHNKILTTLKKVEQCDKQKLSQVRDLLQDDRLDEAALLRLQEVLEILLLVTQDEEVLQATIVLALFKAEVVGKEEIAQYWGKVVEGLVVGTTQLDVVSDINPENTAQQERHKESLRKMLLSLSKDIRVVFIKLAHRLYLMRHLRDYPGEVQQAVAQETREVFAPLANRLGIWVLKWELEDLAFRYLENDTYRMLAKKLERKRVERENYIEEVKQTLEHALLEENINADISGRSKHIYSIWRKMQLKNLDFEQLFDLRAVRVLTDTVAECYAVLGVVHSLWTPVPREFDDYISNPKANNYRSLHTAVRATDNQVVEVQIRTHEMHDFAESGVAAHWRYKENSKYDEGFENKVRWLRQLLNWKQDTDEEQLDQFDDKLSEAHIYVLSPQGEVVELPEGSTALDFAYYIHTDLGHRTRGAKADGKIVQLTEPLQTMQTVEILTTKEIKPSRDWMDASRGYLKTGSARQKVKTWFRKQSLEENIALGKTIAKKEAKKLQITLEPEQLTKRLKKHTTDELYAGIGSGELSMAQLIAAFETHLKTEDTAPVLQKNKSSKAVSGGVIIEGVGGLLTHMASCCHPVGGDPIVGFITQARGVSVHRQDCQEVLHLEEQHPERVIDISWSGDLQAAYGVDVVIDAYARDTLLRDVTLLCANEKVPVLELASKTDPIGNTVQIQMKVEVRDLAHLAFVLAKLEQMHNIISVHRA